MFGPPSIEMFVYAMVSNPACKDMSPSQIVARAEELDAELYPALRRAGARREAAYRQREEESEKKRATTAGKN